MTRSKPRSSLPRSPSRPLTAAAAVAVLATAGALLPAVRAVANVPDTTVTIDVSKQGKTPTHAGAGFLYGLTQDGSGPSGDLLQPLAPTLFRGGGARIAGGGWIGDGYTAGSGYRVRIDSALSQARRVTAAPYHASYHLLVSDLYGADTTQPAGTVYPCDNGDCGNWKTFIDRVVADVSASGVPVDYDIWNEPDGTGFWQRGVNSAQYYRMWDTAVSEIRRLSPSATIVGPSYSGYNHSWLDGFLGQTKADGTVPNVLNWHFGNDPASDSADAASLVSAHGLAPIRQSINEYLFSGQQTSAYTAWFLDRLAVSGVTDAAHAIWSDCCGAGTLDSVLAGTGALQAPTGQWWVYRAYASLSGSMVDATSGNSGIVVAAAADRTRGQAGALIGNNSGQTGTTTITVKGLSSTPWLTAGGAGHRLHATLRRIPDQIPLGTPLTAYDGDVSISNGGISLPATFQSGTDAFWLTLSPQGTGLGTTAIVDGNETGTGTNQFQYGANWGLTTGVPDMYAGTANWSYVGGATATFRFTGSRVALHAVRDVDQGIMSVAIDGGTAQSVDDYAPARNASGVVWTSPALTSGTHTLTITNTGGRNGSSSGDNIAIDRADVEP
ncbi:hypothetical protein NE236_00660 [Actinoallomurus purpureus]|uniref:hypothetical protein n=1 Tax=Actinoallomurus purpureus TaxID=478114 RepID=UPI0020933E7D|nr:hypothetical protein [Actinoallomurus purpureus]MCO6003487.1 hypothetical protein [Actinoallomurus purpureus]